MDPGWKPVVRAYVARLLMPWRWFGGETSQLGGDGLAVIRVIWLSLVIALFLFLLVISFLQLDPSSTGRWPYAVVIAGLLSLWAVASIRKRPLDGTDATSLLKSYLTNFYSGFARAELPALFAFVLVFVTGHLWIYLIGLTFTLAGMLMIAPSTLNLDRYQRQLRKQGTVLSLVEVIRTVPYRRER